MILPLVVVSPGKAVLRHSTGAPGLAATHRPFDPSRIRERGKFPAENEQRGAMLPVVVPHPLRSHQGFTVFTVVGTGGRTGAAGRLLFSESNSRASAWALSKALVSVT